MGATCFTWEGGRSVGRRAGGKGAEERAGGQQRWWRRRRRCSGGCGCYVPLQAHPVFGRPHLLEPCPGPLGLWHQLCGLLLNLHRAFAAGVRLWCAGRVYAADCNASTASPGRSLASAPRPRSLARRAHPQHRKGNPGSCNSTQDQAAGPIVAHCQLLLPPLPQLLPPAGRALHSTPRGGGLPWVEDVTCPTTACMSCVLLHGIGCL